MRWIYLSPHLDDAALSAGGLIYDQTKSGIPVEIWTFMCGFPPEGEELSAWAQANHASWGFSSAKEAIRGRRVEDLKAADILGAKTIHFDFLDCLYRRGTEGTWLYDDINLPPHEEDEDLPFRIAQAISSRVTRDDFLVCQLSVGSHVDHVIVRRAAELLEHPLIYDIDIPYLFSKPGELASKSAGMREKVHGVTETGLQGWQEAILAYKSQISLLGDGFNTPEKVRASIKSYWAERGGVRLLEAL